MCLAGGAGDARFKALMTVGGTTFRMSYQGAKAARAITESWGVSVRALIGRALLAAKLRPKGIRVHAISPGPLAARCTSGHRLEPPSDGRFKKGSL